MSCEDGVTEDGIFSTMYAARVIQLSGPGEGGTQSLLPAPNAFTSAPQVFPSLPFSEKAAMHLPQVQSMFDTVYHRAMDVHLVTCGLHPACLMLSPSLLLTP